MKKFPGLSILCLLMLQFSAAASSPVLTLDFGSGDVSGIKGRGITIGSGAKKMTGTTIAADKFSPAAGSCSFWIKPLDWTPGETPFKIFFSAQGKDYRFMVYKQARGTLLVLVNFQGKTFKTTANISKWQVKQWHLITAVWSPGALHLYVDGNLNNSCSYPAIDRSFKVKRVTAGSLGWKTEKGYSVLDELKLYTFPLKEQKIRDDFQEFASLTKASFEPFEAAAGPGKVTLDGIVSKGEYASAFTGWYTPGSGYKDDLGKIHLASAEGKLFLALEFPAKAEPILYTVDKNGKKVLLKNLIWQGKLPGTIETTFPFDSRNDGIILQLAGKDGVERVIVPEDAGFLKITPVSKPVRFNISKLGKLNQGMLTLEVDSSLKNAAAEISFADDRRVSFISKQKLSDGKLRFTRRFAPDGCFTVMLTEDKMTLFKAVIPAERSSRVTVSGFHTDTAKKSLELTFSKFRRNTAGKMELCLKNLKTGKKYIRDLAVPAEKMIFSISWLLKDMPDGEYSFKAQFVDEKGKKGVPFERLYAIYGQKAPWQDNRIGIIPGRVPPPWTPMKKLENGLQMRMQAYRFGSGLFFDSVKSLDRELLAAPAVLYLNGKEVSGARGKWLSFAADTALFQSRAKMGGFDLILDSLCEYDGAVKQTLRIKGQGEIKNLRIELPLKPEFCRQVYNNDRRGALSGPGATGVISSRGWSRDVYDLPAVWVGSENAGISWCAEHLKNWSNKNKNKTIEIKPGKKSSRFILNLADRPIKINGERVYEFYFQATPVRPGSGIDPLKRINREILSIRGEKYFNYLRAGSEFFDAKKLDQNMALARKRGIKTFLYYVNCAAIGTYTPEWAWWAEKWNARGTGRQVIEISVTDQAVRNRRIYSDCCLNSKSFLDFMLWQTAGIFNEKRFKTQNIYFDSAGPRLCRQKAHGCSWVDDEGKLHPTLTVGAAREFFKRIKQYSAQKAPKAVFFHHASGMAGITLCRSFADGFVGGESMYNGAVIRNQSYIGLFTHDFFSTAFSGEKWGYPIYFIPQQLRAAQMFNPRAAARWQKTPLGDRERRSMRHIIGYFLAHGTSIWVRDKAVGEIQQPVQDLMLKTFGSLENVRFISQSSGRQAFHLDKNHKALRCGAYVKGEKCFAVFFNDSDQEISCAVIAGQEKRNLKIPPRDFIIEIFQ